MFMFVQVGAVVGSAEIKKLAAEAILIASKHNFTDPEIRQNIVEVSVIL